MFLRLYCLVLLHQISNPAYVLGDNINYLPSNDGRAMLLCRKCGADVVDTEYLVNRQSPSSQNVVRQDMFGKKNITIQSLVNPHGIEFDIVTTKKARCNDIGKVHRADTWYPGYTWQLCTCPKCGQHLGWTFGKLIGTTENQIHVYATLDSFHGIILKNILDENFTNSMIMLPEAYRV